MKSSAERKKETVEIWNVCECGEILYSIREGKVGQCASCWVKSMPSDTKSSLGKMISSAFSKVELTDAEKGQLIDDTMSKLKRDEQSRQKVTE